MGGGLPDLGNHIPISNLGLYVLYVVICEKREEGYRGERYVVAVCIIYILLVLIVKYIE